MAKQGKGKTQIRLRTLLLIFAAVFLRALDGKAVELPAALSFGEAGEKTGQEYEIPLRIEGNPGLMGFYVRVSLDAKTAKVTGAKRGDLTKKGVFDFRVAADGSALDILWSGTEEAKGDGALASLILTDAYGFSEKCELTVVYSQEDTFDGAYEDVALQCRKAALGPKEGGGKPEVSNEAQPKEEPGLAYLKPFPAEGEEKEADGQREKNAAGQDGQGAADGGASDRDEALASSESKKGTAAEKDEDTTEKGTAAKEDEDAAEKEAASRRVQAKGTVPRKEQEAEEYLTGDAELDSKTIAVEAALMDKKTGRRGGLTVIGGCAVFALAFAVCLYAFRRRK